MKAGASVKELVFPENFFPTEGFSRQLDALNARVLVLEKEEHRMAMLILEMTSVPADEVEALTKILKCVTGADITFMGVTHSFSVPHFMPDASLDDAGRVKKVELQKAVRDAVTSAAREALENLEEAEMAIGVSECLVNSARDVETPEGWWIANCGPGRVDHRMTTARLKTPAEKDIALMVHYPIQSSVLDGSQLREGGKAVSGDLAGRMTAILEAELHVPVLFLIGAAGDQAPREKAVSFTLTDGGMSPTDLQDDALPILDRLASEMADAARTAIASERPAAVDELTSARITISVPGKKMNPNLRDLHPTRLPIYEAEDARLQPVEVFTIGELKLVGVQPELNCVTALDITENFPMARVVTLVNGASKYMADAQSYDRVTYEAQNSPFGRGAAERLATAAKSLLQI